MTGVWAVHLDGALHLAPPTMQRFSTQSAVLQLSNPCSLHLLAQQQDTFLQPARGYSGLLQSGRVGAAVAEVPSTLGRMAVLATRCLRFQESSLHGKYSQRKRRRFDLASSSVSSMCTRQAKNVKRANASINNQRCNIISL